MATITTMYLWQKHSSDFEFLDARFRWAWTYCGGEPRTIVRRSLSMHHIDGSLRGRRSLTASSLMAKGGGRLSSCPTCLRFSPYFLPLAALRSCPGVMNVLPALSHGLSDDLLPASLRRVSPSRRHLEKSSCPWMYRDFSSKQVITEESVALAT